MALSSLPATNNFDGGAAGSAVTLANSGGTSGDAFTQIVTTNGTVTYSSEAYGLSAKCDCAPPSGSGAVAYVAWELGMVGSPHVGGRFDIFLSAYPVGSNRLGICWLSAAGTNGVTMYVQSDGKIRVQGTTGLVVFTTVEVLPLSTWVRVEFDVTLRVAGHYDIRFYHDRYSTTATATYAADIAWPGAVPADVNLAIFGLFSAGSAVHAYYDNIQLNGTGLPGPVVDPSLPPPPGALPYTNTAQGGTDAAVVTAGNSGGASGEPFQTVTTAGAGTLTYAAWDVDNMVYRVSATSGGSATAAWILPNITRVSGRMEVYLPDGIGPGDVAQYIEITGAAGAIRMWTSGTNWADFWGHTGGTISTPTSFTLAETGASPTEIAYSQDAVPIDQFFAIVFDFDLAATGGSYSVQIMPDLVTSTPSHAWAGSRDWGHAHGPATRIQFGSPSPFGIYFFDNVGVSNAAYVPPAPGTTNDLYANAYTVTVPVPPIGERVPYVSAAEDISTFGAETGEQLLIGYAHTAWWKYTPLTAGSATITVDSGVPNVGIQLFTGSVLSSLTLRASREREPLTFVAAAGVTYSIQVSTTGVPSDLTVFVDGPATVAGETGGWTPPSLTTQPPIQTYPPGQGGSGTIDPVTGAGSSTVLALVREFSAAVRHPVRILGPSTISMVDPAATNDLLGADPEQIYASATINRKASARALSVLTGDIGVAAAATLVTNDASILVSGWSIPDRLPIPGGLSPSPVKSVRMAFTPETFSADVEFHVS